MIDDEIWCINKCKEANLKLFSPAKMEAFCERVAIKVENGKNQTVAREETFYFYTRRE